MQKKITGLVVIAMVMFTTLFAAPVPANINRKVQSTFTEKFSDASNVQWTNQENYIKASFMLNEQIMFAFFDPSGEFMGVSRNILSRELPINLQSQLKKEMGDGWITEVLEFATENETSYYTTIEKPNQQISLKATDFTSWEVIRKVKKD